MLAFALRVHWREIGDRNSYLSFCQISSLLRRKGAVDSSVEAEILAFQARKSASRLYWNVLQLRKLSIRGYVSPMGIRQFLRLSRFR
jgi:hypothetical protein